MKKIVILLLSFAFNIPGYTQQAILHVIDENRNPVSFASTRDATQHIFLSSDSTGTIIIPTTQKFDLVISHVSFNDQPLSIPKGADTTITLVLQYKNQLLEGVIISSDRILKGKKIYRAGHNDKMSFKHHFSRKDKQKIGSLVHLPNKLGPAKYLRSVTFQLEQSRRLRDENFVIEIKVFPVIHNKILPDPINFKPIYVTSNRLKNKNDIIVSEDIKLPYDDILISIELPAVGDGEKNDHLIFIGSALHDDCTQFGDDNTKSSWSEDLLIRGCSSTPFTGKKTSLNIGITYHLAE